MVRVIVLGGVVALSAIAAVAAPPAEAPADVRFDADGETLLWSGVPTATAYHVYRGTSPPAYDHRCRVFRTETPSATVSEAPAAPGDLLYFLVSAVNADGEGPFGTASDGGARPNDAPCVDTDGDLAPDNLDNCPLDANPSQADQDADGTGDRCDPRTYDFEADTPGDRPAAMVQVGGANATFLVRDAGGDLGVAYDGGGGQHDRFDRLPAGMPFQDTTVYLDFEDVPQACSVELWSDGAHGWNAGGGVILQVRDTGELWFYDRRGTDVPGLAGPTVPASGRIRARLIKGPGNASTLRVDAWDGAAWNDDWAVFDVTDDHRYRGLDTVVADYLSGRRIVTRVTIVHDIPPGALTVRKDPSWSSDWKVFQRDAQDGATIPVRLFYRLAEPGHAQARVVDAAGGGPIPGFDWPDHEVALAPAPDGAPAEIILAAVPAGGNYDVEVRVVRDGDGEIVGEGVIAQVAVGDLFLAGGQSNMSGYSGSLTNAEAPIDEVHLFHNDGTWKRAAEPMDDGTDQVDLVSAESPAHSLMLRFGKEIRQATGVPVGIIPGPLGGTNLFNQWQRDEQDHDNRGTLYGSLLHRALLQGGESPPRGFLWFQGESDAGRTIEQYVTDLERLLAQYREDLSNPELYAIIAQLGTYDFAQLDDWLAIQEAQRRVARGDPSAALVTTVDQPRADVIHFSVEGYKQIGVRFAEAARELVYGEPLDATLALVDVRRVGNGREIELEYDGEVTGGAPVLFRVVDSQSNRAVRSITIQGNVVTLQLDNRLRDSAFVSYGYSTTPNVEWLRDLRGTPVPSFRDVPVP